MSNEDTEADRETIELRDRTFQRYSIENHVYYIPVDEVTDARSIYVPQVLTALGRRSKA
jgi:hypothetical protein